MCLKLWDHYNSATNSFKSPLDKWNDTVPFFIRLRQFLRDATISDLPRPEQFAGLVAPSIAGIMPLGWVHDKLSSGSAIVLIDGIDEVNQSRRQEVREWILELTNSFPDARFIVTARPTAIEEGWVQGTTFFHAELQPMDSRSITTFIQYWHDSVARDLQSNEDRELIQQQANSLKTRISSDRPFRSLATNPLLCAMLCALNRDRKEEVPTDKIALYEVCCKMLIERRDRERRVQLGEYPPLNERHKFYILEQLAYWMLRNSYSLADANDLTNRLDVIVPTLQGIPDHMESNSVLQFLLERTGILRETAKNQIDFTHRTFQEYLAAKAILDESSIGLLIEQASNDQWREVILLAIGRATAATAERIIIGLLKKGDESPETRHQVHLLAVASMNYAVSLSPYIKTEVQTRLKNLVPPRSTSDATAIASAKELAVPHLSGFAQDETTVVSSCVRALTLIGGDLALDALIEYSFDKHEGVKEELFRGWSEFDKIRYAELILSNVFSTLPVPHLSNLTSLEGFEYIKGLAYLHTKDKCSITDLSPLREQIFLKSLLLPYSRITTLDSLSQITSLEILDISNSFEVESLIPISHNEGMTSLSISNCAKIESLIPIVKLSSLSVLRMDNCHNLLNLDQLYSLTNLRELNINRCKLSSGLDFLTQLTNLRCLSIHGCQASSLAPLSALKEIVYLDAGGNYSLALLDGIESLSDLETINISNCFAVVSLEPLRFLKKVMHINASYCNKITTLDPLSSLSNLTHVDLSNCSILDLTPLSNCSNIKELNISGTNVSDIRHLTSMTYLERLDIGYCHNITDLSPLYELKNLKYVGIGGVAQNEDFMDQWYRVQSQIKSSI